MKRYPSIPQKLPKKHRNRVLHVFDKIDGSNLRFEWERKKGWVRWGTRKQIVNHQHPTFGTAISIFQKTLAEPIERVAIEQKWESLVAFAEFWGPNSFAGRHIEGESKRLTLFDVAPYRKGYISPDKFLEWFQDLDIPNYLGLHEWNDEFVQRVREGELEGISFEGVVGKAGAGHTLVTAKAKTQEWFDRIYREYGPKKAALLVQS